MSEGLLLSGRYRLVRQLGSGGMGSVWQAQDLNLLVDVAIKLIDPSIAESSDAIGRFRQEAQAAAMIRSTHVVQILDYGVDQDRPFIAMELLKGENLGERLERLGRLSPALTAHILGQVGRALSIAHAWGIVHRDLKPDNVFLVQEGDEEIAKLLDFGVARRMGTLAEPTQSKTRTGAMLGTPYYMSPEQATGQSVDHLTDVWSFGVIAWECLTGKRAFEGDSVGALFHTICMQPLPVPSSVAEVPAGFDEWFARAVARDKSRRFQTIKEAAETLRLVCGRPSRLSQSAELSSGQCTLLSSDSSLSTTGVAAVSAAVRRRESLKTTMAGRLRKRPVLSGVVALSLFALTGLVVMYLTASGSRSGAETQPVAVFSASPNPFNGDLSKPASSVKPPTNAVATGVVITPSLPVTTPPKVKSVGKSVPRVAGGVTSTNPTTPKPPLTIPASHRDDNAAGI